MSVNGLCFGLVCVLSFRVEVKEEKTQKLSPGNGIQNNIFKRKYSKCNSLQVTTGLLNSENLKVAIAHLSNALQVGNFMIL